MTQGARGAGNWGADVVSCCTGAKRKRDASQDSADSLGALLDACERMEAFTAAPQVKRQPSVDDEEAAEAERDGAGAAEHLLVASDGFAPLSHLRLAAEPRRKPPCLPQDAPDHLRAAFSRHEASMMASPCTTDSAARGTTPSSIAPFQVRPQPIESSDALTGPSMLDSAQDEEVDDSYQLRVPQSFDALPTGYLDDTRDDIPPDAAEAIRLAKTSELTVKSVLALVRHRELLKFQARPWKIGEVEKNHTGPACLFAELTSTHRRKHGRDHNFDEWRNNGGKKGVICQAVPAELLRKGDLPLIIARRQGKIRRNGLPDLRYQQFNVSSNARPCSKSGPIILYHVVPHTQQSLPFGPSSEPDETHWQSTKLHLGDLVNPKLEKTRKKQRCLQGKVQLPAVVTFPSRQCGHYDSDQTPMDATTRSTSCSSTSTAVGLTGGPTVEPFGSSAALTSDTSSEASATTPSSKPAVLEQNSRFGDTRGTENSSDGGGATANLSQLLSKRKASQTLAEVDLERALSRLHVYLVTQGGQCRQVILDHNKPQKGAAVQYRDRTPQQEQDGSRHLQLNQSEWQQQQQQQQQQHQQHQRHFHQQQQQTHQLQQFLHFQQLQQMQLFQQVQQQQMQQQVQQQQVQQQQQQQKVRQHPLQQAQTSLLQQQQQQHQLQELQQQLQLLLQQQHERTARPHESHDSLAVV